MYRSQERNPPQGRACEVRQGYACEEPQRQASPATLPLLALAYSASGSRRPRRLIKASFKSGWAKSKPSARSFAGLTRTLASSSSVAISPRTSLAASAGKGNKVGLLKTLPSTLVNSRLVGALGATRLTGPLMLSDSAQKRMARTRSSMWIQLQY